MSTVLVVEDSVAQREMIIDLLKGNGLKVTVASDGVEALDYIQGDLPVVLCSSKGEEFDRYWGMKQGADAYIAKPFQPTELVGTVKQLLRD